MNEMKVSVHILDDFMTQYGLLIYERTDDHKLLVANPVEFTEVTDSA